MHQRNRYSRRDWPRQLIAAACAALFMGGIQLPVSSAQPVSAQEQASKLFDAGLEALDRGDLHGALKAFRRAHGLVPHHSTQSNIIALEVDLGMTLQAHRDVIALLDSPAPIPPEIRKRAVVTRSDIEGKLGQVRVTVDAPGASVRIDGALVDGWTWLEPRSHIITCEAPHRVPARREIVVKSGTAREIDLPLAAVARSDPGRRTAGLLIGGAGAAAVVAGGIVGIRAITLREEADEHCVGLRCSGVGLDLYEDAESAASAANVTVVAGLITLAAGALVVVSSGAFAPNQATYLSVRGGVGSGAGYLNVGGTW